MSETEDKSVSVTVENAGPGPLELLGDKEWQNLLEKDDRTSPAEYPDMVLITRAELGGAMCEAWLLAKEKPDPNPEWEALADAYHAKGLAEHGIEAAATLDMLEHWKADAEPANRHGQVSFSRALLDSATDALRATLAELRECAATFRRYEQLHREKGTVDGELKANANAARAERCEAVIGPAPSETSSSSTPVDPPEGRRD